MNTEFSKLATRPGTLFQGTPIRSGVYRVFDGKQQTLGLAFWHGDKWGPSTFDRHSINKDETRALKKAAYAFWAHYREPKTRKIPFGVSRLRADVTQLLKGKTPSSPCGLVLTPHLAQGEPPSLPVFCYVPPLIAQQSDALCEDGAYELLVQPMIEPPRQWRSGVGDAFIWVEAVHLTPIKRRRAAVSQTKFAFKKDCLTLKGPGQPLTLSNAATATLKQLIGA